MITPYISANGLLRVSYGQTDDGSMIIYASLPLPKDRESKSISDDDIAQADTLGKTLLRGIADKLQQRNYALTRDATGQLALGPMENEPHITCATIENPQAVFDNVENFMAAFDAAYHEVLREQKSLAAYMGNGHGPAQSRRQP